MKFKSEKLKLLQNVSVAKSWKFLNCHLFALRITKLKMAVLFFMIQTLRQSANKEKMKKKETTDRKTLLSQRIARNNNAYCAFPYVRDRK